MRHLVYVQRSSSSHRAGFTLTELIVAVALLVGVLVAASKVFTTTSKVTRIGEATNNIIQDFAAAERRFRDDFATLSRDGFLGIRCVAVPNDHYGTALLNPNRAPDAMIRSDQLVFFSTAITGSNTYTHVPGGHNIGALHRGRTTATRLYYGHAFSAGLAGRPFETEQSFDPDELVFPWTKGPVRMTRIKMAGNATMWDRGNGQNITVPIPDARRWLFLRQPIMLATDDIDNPNFPSLYLRETRTGRSIFYRDPSLNLVTPEVQASRVDAAAMRLSDVRRSVMWIDPSSTTSSARAWRSSFSSEVTGYELIRDQALYYPRAERYAPSSHRVDQVLTNPILLGGCSDVRIEWTWDEGVGETIGPDGTFYRGVVFDESNPSGPRWFGLPDDAAVRNEDVHGVTPYRMLDEDDQAWTIDRIASTGLLNTESNIEEWDLSGAIKTYTALFGYNQNTPLNNNGVPDYAMGYTPWPTAIRITLTLHDPALTLEGGREFQFVMAVPTRQVD